MPSRIFLILLMTGILALPLTGYAQEATLSGQVTDTTGAVLPGVVVRAIHEASGNTTEVVTDGRGGFRIPARIGTHQITAELAGFTTVTRTGLSLSVGQEIVVNLQMSPSTVQETVEVFNLFNHENYGNYVTAESNRNYGRPTATAGTSATVQNVAYQSRSAQFGFRVAF